MFKVLSLTFILSFIVLPFTTFAQEEIVQLADINMSDAQIVEQVGNDFDISFDLVNGEGSWVI